MQKFTKAREISNDTNVKSKAHLKYNCYNTCDNNNKYIHEFKMLIIRKSLMISIFM